LAPRAELVALCFALQSANCGSLQAPSERIGSLQHCRRHARRLTEPRAPRAVPRGACGPLYSEIYIYIYIYIYLELDHELSVSRMCCCIAGVSRLIDSWVGPLGAPQTQLLPCRGRSTSHIALITSGHACTAHLGSGAPSDASVLGGPLLFASACQCSCDHQPLLGASLSTSR
jgi:hypothetical protein